MPRNQTTGDFNRVSNSFSEPVYGAVIDPTDANSLFDDYDGGLTFNDTSPLILIGSTSGVTKIQAADIASGTITLPAGTTDFSATGGTAQFVRQDSAGAPFTVTAIPASAIASPAALTRVDDTNVTLTLGGSPSVALLAATSLTVGWTGTLAAGRLNSNVVQGVTNDTNVTGSITAQNLTLGWTGTLAAARLNANVVQAITNDTNVTGSITAQNLTLGWTGLLGVSRGGTGLSSGTSGGVLGYTASGMLASSASLTANGVVLGGGTGATPTSTSAGTNGQVLMGNTSSAPTFQGMTNSITFIIDGGGSTITTGIKGDLTIPFGYTITEWTLLADQSGSIVVDIWADSYANYPPTVADTITASAKPTISTATKGQSSTLTGWTTTQAAGRTLRFNVDSITSCTRVTLSLKVTRTSA